MTWPLSLCVTLLCVVVLLLSAHHTAAVEKDDAMVTCGSMVKLKHVPTGFRLHSHEIPYGNGNGGSGQQSVTAHSAPVEVNSYWIVKGAHGSDCTPGAKIPNGATIRLMHAPTRKNLHTHNQFRSPLSQQQEVSCYGQDGEGDKGDNWRLRIIGGTGVWTKSDQFRLHHEQTGFYLHSHQHRYDIQIIQGQQEVTGFQQANNDNLWTVAEGVFLPVRKPDEL